MTIPSIPAGAVGPLRADLLAADWTVSALEARLGPLGTGALARGDRAAALWALRGERDAVAVLVRLFVLGEAQTDAAVASALPRCGREGLEALGLAESADGLVRARLELRPYALVDELGAADWWIASDLAELQTGAPLADDHVLGVGGASLTLLGLQLPVRGGRVLDLGTGCGIQAMHAARRADSVVATDVSARALRIAALNLALNAVDGVELREGSLYEPVAGERFDRIVSNPPFVITPRATGVPAYEYRDGGLVGDALVEAVVRGAAEHLVPGGTAQLLGNWEYRGRDGLERAADWASSAGLEHWIVERERLDPAAYAELWIRDGGTTAGPDWERLVTAWLDDFGRRGVASIGLGSVLLRRPSDRIRLTRSERLGERTAEHALGGHLAAVLAELDALPEEDAALGALVLRVAEDVTEERSHWPGAEAPSAIVLRQGGGYGRAIRADPALAAVVGACDGELPLGAIEDAVAELLEVDADELRTALAPELRELVAAGLLRR